MNDFQYGSRKPWMVPLPEGFCLLFIAAMAGMWVETRIENLWLNFLWVAVTSFATGSMAAKIGHQGGRRSHFFTLSVSIIFVIALIPVRMWVHAHFGVSS